MNRSLFALATSVLLAGALGVSCGDNEPDDSNPGASGGSNPGTGGIDQGGSGAGESVCAPSQKLCDEFCASTASDPLNCGTCGIECGAGEGCMDGVCETFEKCTTGQVICDDACTNLQADRNHCGACGTSCGSGEVCDNGLCATSCLDGRIECGGGCIDPMTDRLYCGATDCDAAAGGAGGSSGGESCADGEVCSGGSCTTSCPAGQIICDNRCITPASDRDFCGATDCSDEATNGETCATGEVCGEGFCTTSCPAGQIVCGSSCVDPQTDRRYCGASDCSDESTNGEVCADSMVCSEGACEASCADGYLDCNDTCIDPLSNNDFCGATDCSDPSTNGDECTTEQSCQIGQCRTFLFDWSTGVPISSPDLNSGEGQVIGTDALGNTLVVFKQFGVNGDVSTVRLYSRRYLFATKTWTPIIRVDVGIEKQARNQVVAVNQAGQAYVVWDTTNEIYGAAYDGSTNQWSTPVRLDDAVVNITRETPTVAIDGEGNAWVAWSQGTTATTFRIARTYYDRAAHSHTIPEVLTGYGEIDDYKSYLPVIKMNEEGDAALVWSEQDLTDGIDSRYRVMGTVQENASSWTAPSLLSGGPRITPWLGPADLGIDDAGNAYVVWTHTEKPEDWPNYDANVVMLKISAGIPGPIVNIESETKILHKPRISTDGAGDSVVAYYGADYAYFNDPHFPAYDDVDGPWEVYATRVDNSLLNAQTTLLVTIPDPTPADAAPDKDNINPSVVLDGLGNSHVTWTQGNRVDTAAYSANVGGWGAPVNLVPSNNEGTSASVAMSAAPGGRAFATWYQGGKVVFARYD